MSDRQFVYGLHAAAALVRRRGARILRACVQEGRQDARMEALVAEIEARGMRVERLPRRELDRLAPDARHQGVVLEVAPAVAAGERELDDFLVAMAAPALILVLDGVQDPHNLGACLRTADAAGVQGVILPKDRSATLTPVVRKVACGAAETLPLFAVTNLARTLRTLQAAGVWVYGAAGESAQSLYEVDFTGPVALVLGAEGTGLRRLTREHCDGLVQIPMAGTVESLNVSVAAGVLLYEVVRQRRAGRTA